MQTPAPGWTNPLGSSSAQKDLGTVGWTRATGVPLVAVKADSMSSCMKRSIAKRSREGTVPFYSSLIGQHLEYRTRLLLTERSESAEGHQCSQGVQHLPCEMRLMGLGSLSLEGEEALGEPNSSLPVPKRLLSRRQSMALYSMHSGSTRGNELEMREFSTRNKEEKNNYEDNYEGVGTGCPEKLWNLGSGGLQDPDGQSSEPKSHLAVHHALSRSLD